jgi:hypothetical protein
MPSLCFAGGPDYARVVDFGSAVIERQMEGDRIEAYDGQGWAWFELSAVDPSRGGSTRAEVDALRLAAVFLGHWDNKAENQRLVCPPAGAAADAACAAPFAIVQDLGATFGPVKVDLPNWRRTPVWSDAKACAVSMHAMPYRGATFPDVRISEAGRRLLLRLLDQLSAQQVLDLFEHSGLVGFDQLSADARGAEAWAAVFRDKVRQIRDAGPCAE